MECACLMAYGLGFEVSRSRPSLPSPAFLGCEHKTAQQNFAGVGPGAAPVWHRWRSAQQWPAAGS